MVVASHFPSLSINLMVVMVESIIVYMIHVIMCCTCMSACECDVSPIPMLLMSGSKGHAPLVMMVFYCRMV